MATKVSINKALEARLRAAKDVDLIADVVRLLDDAQRAAGSRTEGGLGYKELVALLRSELGADLALPPEITTILIVKVINKVREYGITKEHIPTLVRGLKKGYPRGPYGLWFIVSRADAHFTLGNSENTDDTDGPAEDREFKVYTGRR